MATSELAWVHKWGPILGVIILGVAATAVDRFTIGANAEDIKDNEAAIEENADDIDRLENRVQKEGARIQLELQRLNLQMDSANKDAKRRADQQDQKLDTLLEAVRGN